MVLNGGSLDGIRILAPLAAREMGRNQNPPGLNGHTLGWFIRPSGYLPAGDFLPEDTFGHTGFTGTSLLLCPSLGVGIALLTNRVYQQREATDFLRFRRRFHNAVAGLLT
jgi:CubicO group peptidase (beta-lactamase class C family)